MVIPKETLLQILHYGVMAPSGDNLQPWIFRPNGERLDLLINEKKDHSLYNTRYTASLVALGSLLENIHIAAQEMGYLLTTELFPKGEHDPWVASIQFKEGQKIQHPLFRFIPQRCTNRKPYSDRKLDPAARTALLNAIQETSEGQFLLIEDELQKKIVAQAASLHDRILFESKTLRDSFLDTLRWTPKEIEKTRDGLDIKTLELGAREVGFRLLKSCGAFPIFSALGLSRLIPPSTCRLFRKSSAFGFLRMHHRSPRSFVHGGRLLQRIWLTATSQGLAFQPMAGTLYLLQRLHLGETQDFSEAHLHLLEEAETLFQRVFPTDKKKAMILLFRVGYAPPPSSVSLRQEISLQ